MNEKRYMKNTVTGVIFPYDPAVMTVSTHMAECTAEGVLIGRAPVAENTMLEKISELQNKYQDEVLRSARFETAANNALAEVQKLKKENLALASEITRLKDKIAKMESTQVPLTDKLNSMTFDDLRKEAKELGIKNYSDLTKESLVTAILAARKGN